MLHRTKIEEEPIKQEMAYQPAVKEYDKVPISICRLNLTFQQIESQDSRVQFNRIDKEFRQYVQQFSVIKKKDDAVRIIEERLRGLLQQYINHLLSLQLDKKEYNRRYKKYKRAQIKAWNLNLDKAEDIRVVCNADEIPEQFLRDIAAIIKNDNHD